MLSGISIAFVQPAMIPRQSLGSMLLSVKKEIAMARFLIRMKWMYCYKRPSRSV